MKWVHRVWPLINLHDITTINTAPLGPRASFMGGSAQQRMLAKALVKHMVHHAAPHL
jgi:hypothetical protein